MTTTNTLAKTLAANGRVTMSMTKTMSDGIAADRFARLASPSGNPVQSNHPCFVFGHLALYNSYICRMVGNEQAAKACEAPEGWNEIFGMGQECKDDADGSIYPDMEEVINHCAAGFATACNAVEAAGDEPLLKPLADDDGFGERMGFSTTGDAVNFMLTIHPQLHLGQVSAWRRMEGLGSALGF